MTTSTQTAMHAATRTATHMLAVAKILHPQHVSLRAEQNDRFLKSLIADLEDGAELPPTLVFHDGTRYWLADGEACLRARKEAGQQFVPCDVRKGTRQDAIEVGLALHRGQNRQWWRPEDRRHATLLLLNDPEMSKWNNAHIGRLVGFTTPRVHQLRVWLQEQEEARQEKERQAQKAREEEKSMCKDLHIGTRSKPSFKDPEPEKPKQEMRTVERQDGSTYQYPVKPKKHLPERYDVSKPEKQLPRSFLKAFRQLVAARRDPEAGFLAAAAACRRGEPVDKAILAFLEETR